MRFVRLAPLLVIAALLGVACTQQDDAVTQDVVANVPWPDEERAEYVLLDRDNREVRGRGVLSVTRHGDQFALGLRFEGEGDTDESEVIVNAETLKPVSSHREVSREDTTIDAEYNDAEGIVTITETKEEGERGVPLRLEDHYYDNDSSLFVWRSVSFAGGYEARYHSVLAANSRQVVLSLRVVGKEEVVVPAGTFDAWRLEVRFGEAKQTAWYADTPERPLVQYDNTRSLMQLAALP